MTTLHCAHRGRTFLLETASFLAIECMGTPARAALVSAAFFVALVPTAARAADFIVVTNADSGVGSLRQAIIDSNAAGGSNNIIINSGVGTITLVSDLPTIANNATIVGNNNAIDGNNQFRGLFIGAWAPGTATQVAVAVTVQDLTIQNTQASGGASQGRGGGGAGLGGAIFVANLANVTVNNVVLSTNKAVGGSAANSWAGGGAGGGMGGNANGGSNGGGGGLGSGAVGIGGPGIATGAADGGGGGGANTGGGVGGSAGGGAGGFGGGGGGNVGGAGGFGGGGGGSSGTTLGGNGGFGGGGGGSQAAAANSIGGFGGGSGYGSNGGGGGGLGAGGAIFVQSGGSLSLAGTLTINGNSVSAGNGQNGGGNGSAFGSGIFFQGNANGTLTTLSFGAGNQSVGDTVADYIGSGGTNPGGGGNAADQGGSLALAKTGTGTLTLTAANTYSGGTTVTGGLINFNAASNFGSGLITLNGGGLQWATGNTSDISGRLAALGSNGATFDTNGNNVTLASTLSGAGSLTKTGAGTLTLGGGNTYSGTTTINGGALTIAALGTLASNVVNNATFNNKGGLTGDVTNNAGGVFNQTGVASAAGVTNNGTVNAYGGSFSGAIANNGGGSFNVGGAVSGGSTFTNSANAALNVAGTGSTFTLTGLLTNSGTVAVAPGGKLMANGGITNSAGGKIFNYGTMIDNLNSSGLVTNNGTITGAVTVSGGTLSGIGNVGNTQINASGTLAPGSGAPGSAMSVAGSLAFQSGAIYLVQLNPTTASNTNVTGTATLGGATVNAQFANGSYVAKQYTILTAGSVSGQFNSTVTNTNLPLGFKTSLSYDGTHAYLNLALSFTPPVPPNFGGGLSGNQQNVGNAIINFFNTNGGIPIVFGGLTGGGLSQVSGEAATGAQQGAFQLGGQFLNLLLDPFVDGRGGMSGGGALGFAPERETLPEDIALAYARAMKAPVYKAPAASEQKWTAWGSAFGGYNTTKGDAIVGSHDLTARAGGVAAGLDYRLTPDSIIGFGLAGGTSSWSLVEGQGGGRSDAFQAGIYSKTRSGPLYLAGSFAFANHWMSTDRTALGDHLTADFTAQSFGGRIESGYRFASPIVAIAPYAALQAQSFRTPFYSETDLTGGGFGLSYNARNATDTRSELGSRFDRANVLASGALLTLRSRVAWAHDWGSDPSATAVFQALPGASFIVNGARPATDAALASLGAELRLANGVTLASKLDGEFASRSSTYTGTGTLRVAW